MYQAVEKLFPIELVLEDAPRPRRDSSSSVTMQDVFWVSAAHTQHGNAAGARSLKIELWLGLKK